MKRKVYEIKLNGDVVGVKNAWNSSRKFIMFHLSHNMKGSTSEEISFEHVNFITGKWIWKDDAGNVMTYEIDLK